MPAAELSVFYYALFSWRARRDTIPGYQTFTCEDASGYRLFATLLIVVLIFEGAPMHFLLLRWSHVAAWISTALDLYGVLWVVAIARSVYLRPILVGADSVLLRAGFMWQVDVARRNIIAVRPVRGEAPPRRQPGYLSLVIINEPQFVIELAEPVMARGLYKRPRSVSRIGVALDNPQMFAAALAAR